MRSDTGIVDDPCAAQRAGEILAQRAGELLSERLGPALPLGVAHLVVAYPGHQAGRDRWIDFRGSWNCGGEGPTDHPAVERLRNRQVMNLLAVVLLALGTPPMLLMGNEMRRSQRGKNNAYCLDDDTTWLDWSLLGRHEDLRRARAGWNRVVLRPSGRVPMRTR